ncbi:MAG: carbohydrate kinase, partial [Clostridia bacterium]|nr:carbohydrate kinase [Clostridia bacterium]
MKIAGLDIGTTGCKLTVFDGSGKELGKAYRDYPVRRAVSGHEIDVTYLMDSVYAVIGEMTSTFGDLGGIGVTSFGETFVMTDGEGKPLHTSMLYTDPRGADECAEIKEKLGDKFIARVTGLAPHEMYSLCKLMWLKRHEPGVYAAAKHIFLIGDYVVWHLTGKAQIDYSLATRTMAFDINTLTWSKEIFDAAGIDVSLMSAPVPPGTPAGSVTPEAAGRTGLGRDCMIVTVAHDQVAAAVGAGVFDGSKAVDGAGTVECLTPIYDSLPDIEVMAKGYFSVVPYVVP